MIEFKEYLLTQILEKMELNVKELELILSPKLTKTLKEMNHVIADDLLAAGKSSERTFKATFVDLGSEPGTVTFIQANKVPELIEPELVHGDYTRETEVIPAAPYKGKGPRPKEEKNWIGGYFDYVQSYKNPWISDASHVIDLHDPQFKSKDHPVWTKLRSADTNIARFINSAFPKKYPENVKKDVRDSGVKLNDIGSFAMMFKATVEANSKIIKVVSGKDIPHFYNCENYFKGASGNLNSCMADPDRARTFLKIYEMNPEKVQLMILFPEDERTKIIGRALLWKCDEPDGRYFMDRIYVANDSDQYLFIEYAKSHGYIYKTSQSFGWSMDMIDGKSGERDNMYFTVNVKPYSEEEGYNYPYYPYVDTLNFYNPETGELTSAGSQIAKNGSYLILNDTRGGDSGRYTD